MPLIDVVNILQTVGITGAMYGGSKKCILVRGSSYRNQAIAEALFTGIIAPGWNKLQILANRRKYCPSVIKEARADHAIKVQG